MKSFRQYFLIVLLIVFSSSITNAQGVLKTDTVKAGTFDNGKMWTFDYPPLDYFEKTYGFRPSQEWLDGVRMSALRFATYCSASFVSADGLVMTNHHCSRESGFQVQQKGEDFNNNGFYAATLADERKVPGLFVDQLVKMEDITARIQKAMDAAKTDAEQVQVRENEFAVIKKEYAEKADWKGLEIQTVTFYKGGKYSLYGFKRYKDVRLVVMPELQLGFFGGDFDNFTYPRYCLDFTFFRVYDDNGQPFKPQYYFKFNPAGAKDGEPVFVVGNPGSTNRQATVSILEYLRDTNYPATLDFLKGRSGVLQEYNMTAKSDSILNLVFSLENTIKARNGMLEGLQDPYIMARRKAFETDFKTAVGKNPKISSQMTVWDEISKTQSEIAKQFPTVYTFAPNPFKSDAFTMASMLVNFANTTKPTKDAATGNADEATVTKMKNDISNYPKKSTALEQKFLTLHLKEAKSTLGEQDEYVKTALQGRTPEVAAAEILKTTKIYDATFRKELLDKGADAINASQDPLLVLTRISQQRFSEGNKMILASNAKMDALRAKLARLLFEVYGTSIPPDATFSLRISDGIVKGYEYNGTKAPYQTTFFGLYERYFSFKDNDKSWDLPERWKNPPMDLLQQPMNFVSTNDIIGGNSGSPMINKNREIVGLIFDGNMESLPGNYIFMPEKNRTVSVHAGGMVAALKYIYKADRIVKELTGK